MSVKSWNSPRHTGCLRFFMNESISESKAFRNQYQKLAPHLFIIIYAANHVKNSTDRVLKKPDRHCFKVYSILSDHKLPLFFPQFPHHFATAVLYKHMVGFGFIKVRNVDNPRCFIVISSNDLILLSVQNIHFRRFACREGDPEFCVLVKQDNPGIFQGGLVVGRGHCKVADFERCSFFFCKK